MENQDQQQLRVGMDVIDSADRFIGTIESLEPDHFVVQKGFFFPKSHRIPNIAIGKIRQNELTLQVSLAEVINSNDEMKWANQPGREEIVQEDGEVEKPAATDSVDPRKI